MEKGGEVGRAHYGAMDAGRFAVIALIGAALILLVFLFYPVFGPPSWYGREPEIIIIAMRLVFSFWLGLFLCQSLMVLSPKGGPLILPYVLTVGAVTWASLEVWGFWAELLISPNIGAKVGLAAALLSASIGAGLGWLKARGSGRL